MEQHVISRDWCNLGQLRLLLFMLAMTAAVGLSPLCAQEEEEEGESIIWGEEEGIEEDFFDEDEEFFDEGEELFDDEFSDEEFGDDLDDFLVDEEPIEDDFFEETVEEELMDLGYGVRLSAASPAFVNSTLMTWNSLIDIRLGADLPFTFRLGPIRMRIGAELVTYKFINYLPEGGEFSGVGVYGMVTFPAGPSDMHGGIGFLGSSPAVVVGQSFGLPYAENIIFKMGTRATLTLTAPEQFKESGPRATWFEGFFTVVYNLDM
ncbi:MAG: hypothetical protein VX822_02775 [Candidatus Neomarinimicrobiota bacterium]|nr:hypothetical protein [Candidatus Neomarinimicrobiota bacterium]